MSITWQDESVKPTVLEEIPADPDPLGYSLKKRFLGKALNRHELSHQRLSKRYALGILSSDCISSSAYGSEQILIALIPAFGLLSFTALLPMTIVILTILVLLTLSYNNVISQYTSSGGAYIVARENLGTFWSIVAAVALILDYVVTIAIQSAAGVVAVASYVPSLAPYISLITIGVSGLLTYANLRGVKEAGKSFALPTYLFAISMLTVFAIGLIKDFKGGLGHLSTTGSGLMPLGHSTGFLSIASVFILLRAFANGGSSLTGLEAISNGVSLFKVPEGRNARQTMNFMSGLLGTLVFGVSWFAIRLHAVPYDSGAPSLISVIAKNIVGNGLFGTIWFGFVQFATMLILIAGANTVYNAFPILAANIAEDGFLPRQFSKRGHKLVYSNGILVCSGLAIALILFTGGSVNRLVALYALGVFTAFAITGYGMFIHARRNKGKIWRMKAAVSLLASMTSALVVAIFATVKFTEGAWLVVIVGPVLVISMYRLSKQYAKEQEALELDSHNAKSGLITRHDVSVLVDGVDIATLRAVRYARSLKPRHLQAVHFVIDDKRAERIQELWEKTPALSDLPLKLVDCPDRRIPAEAAKYARKAVSGGVAELTLVLPRRTYSRVLGRVLHDRTAEAIAEPISRINNVVATIIPVDVNGIIHTSAPELQEFASHSHAEDSTEVLQKQARKPESATIERPQIDLPISHFEPNLCKIGEVVWRKQAHILGQVTSVFASGSSQSPNLSVEVWDETGGITLEFLGRRHLAGVKVGSIMKAEGMVGERGGHLIILNPTYELTTR